MNVQLIKDSFELAKPIATEVIDKFYETLWSSFPESKPLFANVDMTRQKKALLGSLVYIVDHVDNPAKLIPYLKKMGARHVGYGTKDAHYRWVGESLLSTFKFFFKEKWTTELHNNWVDAFNFISEKMIEGANEAEKEKSSKCCEKCSCTNCRCSEGISCCSDCCCADCKCSKEKNSCCKQCGCKDCRCSDSNVAASKESFLSDETRQKMKELMRKMVRKELEKIFEEVLREEISRLDKTVINAR